LQVDLFANPDKFLLVKALVAIGFSLSAKAFHEDLGLLGYREHSDIVRVDSLAGLGAKDLAGKAILHGSRSFTRAHFYIAGLEYGLLD